MNKSMQFIEAFMGKKSLSFRDVKIEIEKLLKFYGFVLKAFCGFEVHLCIIINLSLFHSRYKNDAENDFQSN